MRLTDAACQKNLEAPPCLCLPLVTTLGGRVAPDAFSRSLPRPCRTPRRGWTLPFSANSASADRANADSAFRVIGARFVGLSGSRRPCPAGAALAAPEVLRRHPRHPNGPA